MAEYKYESIIINPNKEGIESLIGKEVYFHDNPSLCLENANEKSTSSLGILVEIRKNSVNPFRVEQKCGVYAYSCIIEKKEEPKKYVPFTSMKEFVERYKEVMVGAELDSFEDNLFQCGMCLKFNKSDVICMVSEIWADGVFLGSARLRTKWKELLMLYTFLDGSPCGKEVKE